MKRFYLLLVCFLLGGLNHLSYAAKNEQEPEKAELIPWNEVNEILPKYTKFTVHDIETGKEFKVQRRAGRHHADVQPLTSRDTKIMKEIYDGKWSWKRRAIIVIHKKKKIAASMHGMPHGAGALKNNFPGHFCIHFYGSKTHQRNRMDPSHKLMVLKAAGKLDKYLQKADPFEVTSSYVIGYKEQDGDITSLISLQKADWERVLPFIENVSIVSISKLAKEDYQDELNITVPVEIDWVIEGTGVRRFRGNVHLVRFSPADPWKIDTDKFLKDNLLPFQ